MSALRALRQVVRVSARSRVSSVVRASAFSTVPRSALTLSTSRAFSISAARLGSGTTDIALSQKLQEELRYEAEENPESGTPEFLKAFLEQGVWSIEDVPGHDEVAVTRKFGDESIRIVFSIADIQAEAEDFEQAAETEGEETEETDTAYPVRASLSITKSTVPGALNVDMVCQEGHFLIENVSFYDNAKLGTELTAEADWKRRGMYIGPQFDTLDISLQEEFEKFLQERGINENVALFIPEYAEFKEQNEYVKWLGKVKNFVDL